MVSTDELAELLDRLRGAWMAGGSAMRHCPEAWRPMAGEGPAAERALAALAGQALQAAFRPAAGGLLIMREPLPALALPTVAEGLRPRLRRLFATQPGAQRALLTFLAARGAVMHPADWLPARRDEALPTIYEPWVRWAHGDPPPAKAAPKPPADLAALAAELAGMLSLETVGLLARRRRLALPKLKTSAQSARRLALLKLVTPRALAAAMGCEPAALVRTAPAGAEADLTAFTAMIAASAEPSLQAALLAAILEDAEAPLAAARPLAAALDAPAMAAFLPATLRREASMGFELTLELAAAALGRARLADLEAAPGFAAWRDALSAPEEDAAKSPRVKMQSSLTALGLLADAPAARHLLALCLGAGMSPADPKLDELTLNAELHPETHP